MGLGALLDLVEQEEAIASNADEPFYFDMRQPMAGRMPAITQKVRSRGRFLSGAGRNDRAKLLSVRALQLTVHPLHQLFRQPVSVCCIFEPG